MRNAFIAMLMLSAGWASAQDVLHLTDGTVYRGRLKNLASTQIQMEVQLPGVAGSAERRFETHQVEFIEFAPLKGEAEALANPDSPTQQERLLALWQEKSVRLAWPTNNAGSIGLAYADILLESADSALLSILTEANALLIRPVHAPALHAGQEVDYLPI